MRKPHWIPALVLSSVLTSTGLLAAPDRVAKAAPKARPEPQIVSLFPGGAARGARLQVDVRGRNLDEAYAVWVDCSSITGEVKTVEAIKEKEEVPVKRRTTGNAGQLYRAVVELSVATKTLTGIHSLRLVSPGGVSNPSAFVVHEEPLTLETELSEEVTLAARRLPATPVVVGGKIEKPGEVDNYLVEAEPGREMLFQILNSGNFDPQLSLSEVSGSWFKTQDLKRVAFNDEPNPASKKMNPKLSYRFDRKGRFVLQVGSFLGRGSPDASYQLRVVPATERSLVLSGQESAHPVENRWEERDFARELSLDRLRALKERSVVIPEEKPAERAEAKGIAAAGGGVVDAVSTGGEAVKPKAPIDSDMVLVSDDEVKEAKQQFEIPVPALIEGTIGQPGDVDKFRFQVKDGTRLAFEIQTPQRPAPFFTPRIGVFDESGQEVLNNLYVYTYGSGEFKANVVRSKVIFNFEHGGEYRLDVEDMTSRNGGPDYRYRVSVRPQVPHVGRIDVASTFARTFDGSIKDGPEVQRLNLVPGGVKKIVVLTEQEEGFNGEIALNFEGLPPGVTVFPATETQPERPGIPDEGKKELYRPAQQEVTIVLAADANAPVTRLPHMVRLKARPVVGGILGTPLPVHEFPMMVVSPEDPGTGNAAKEGAEQLK